MTSMETPVIRNLKIMPVVSKKKTKISLLSTFVMIDIISFLLFYTSA